MVTGSFKKNSRFSLALVNSGVLPVLLWTIYTGLHFHHLYSAIVRLLFNHNKRNSGLRSPGLPTLASSHSLTDVSQLK